MQRARGGSRRGRHRLGGRRLAVDLGGDLQRDSLDLGVLLRKRASVAATSPRARPADEKAAIVAAVREHVWPLIEAGAVRPIIHSRMPLAQAADAHRLLESSTHIGKVLLTA